VDISALPQQEPIEVLTPSGRSVKLKWLTAGGLDAIARAARARLSPFDCMTTVLHYHLLEPVATLEELRKWPKTDLDAIGQGWATHDLGLDTELTGDDVATAFQAVAEECAKESAQRLRMALGNAFESLKSWNNTWLRPTATESALVRMIEGIQRSQLGAESAVARMIEGIQRSQLGAAESAFARMIEEVQRSQDHWRTTLGFGDVARVFLEQNRMASSLSSVRFVEEMARAARTSYAGSVFADLAETAKSFEAALGYRSQLDAFAIAETRSLATRLGRGLESLTKSGEAVWRDWGGAFSGELQGLPSVLYRAPTVEVYAASAGALGLVAEPPSAHPQLYTEREDEVVASLPGLLASVSVKLVEMYQGAVSLVESTSADSNRHFSISLRELMNHALRLLAPDASVTQWAEKSDDDFVKGHPTRPGRVRYIMRRMKNTAYEPFIREDMRQVVRLIEALNDGTHAIDSEAEALARKLVLRRVEFFVSLLIEVHKAAQ
jgi:hypothetical protein